MPQDDFLREMTCVRNRVGVSPPCAGLESIGIEMVAAVSKAARISSIGLSMPDGQLAFEEGD